MDCNSPVIVALDFEDADSALQLVSELNPGQCRLKVGKELFTAAGPTLLDRLHERGFEVFLDLKFHDIPNTVAKAVAAAARRNVWMVNVHASGGTRMMCAAREALDGIPNCTTKLIAVTVLTSMSEEDLAELGAERPLKDQVLHLAKLTQAAGLDGVVCSAQEASRLKRECGRDFLLVTPGIRAAGDSAGDQRRVLTPEDAVAAGSDYLVIGRSITAAESPLQKLQQINQSLAVSE